MRAGFKKFIFCSALLHVLFFCLIYIFAEKNKINTPLEALEISFVNEKDFRSEPKKIVETDSKTANDQFSKNAKYLSEKSNLVEKETRAKTGAKFHQEQKQQTTKASSKNATFSKSDFKKELFDNSFNAYNAVVKNEKARQAGSSATNDSLENAKDDLVTRLNTREYKYFGYYNRIKNQLNQWWVPNVQQKFNKMLRQGRTIASQENKITKLIIVLNTEGALVKVQVLAESGVKDLDDAAIEAFRSAAPFPNPPRGIIETDGTVKIRWDCVVES